MTVSPVLDAAGRRRSPATMPGYHAGRPPRNKGRLYPADPPTVEEIVAVMREASDDRHGFRLRALIVVLWRGGLRVAEALALGERDLDPRRGSLLVRNGKGGRRREIGMDAWGWEQLRPWLAARVELPVGPLFCVIDGPTRGRPWSSANVRVEFRRLAAQAGIRRRFAPHQLRHAHAVELAREGVPLNVIQRQLGHANLGTTSHLPAGHRHRRDHRHRPRPARADDVRHRRTPALTNPKRDSGSAADAPAAPSTRPPLREPLRSLRDLAGAYRLRLHLVRKAASATGQPARPLPTRAGGGSLRPAGGRLTR